MVGYTDARGDEASNLSLSKRRAEAVIGWFVEHGVDRSRINAGGKGECCTHGPDASEADMQLDRRVEIRVER